VTKAEEEGNGSIMAVCRNQCSRIIDELPSQNPAYNTGFDHRFASLESKGFVDHEQEGRGYSLFSVGKKSDYGKSSSTNG